MGRVTDRPKGRQTKLIRNEIGYTTRVPQRGKQAACGSHTHTHTDDPGADHASFC